MKNRRRKPAMKNTSKTFSKIKYHIQCVQEAIWTVTKQLDRRATEHDKSKFKADEFAGYQRFDDMPEGLEYGSDEYKAEMAKVMKDNNCYKIHCKRNDHHPEHYDKIENMPLLAIIEMVCDWKGAQKSYGNTGEWMDGVQKNISRFGFTPNQVWAIEQVAELLND